MNKKFKKKKSSRFSTKYAIDFTNTINLINKIPHVKSIIEKNKFLSLKNENLKYRIKLLKYKRKNTNLLNKTNEILNKLNCAVLFSNNADFKIRLKALISSFSTPKPLL